MMSDIFNHEADAWDSLLFNDDDDEEGRHHQAVQRSALRHQRPKRTKMTTETYVMGDAEVKLTGRTASRQVGAKQQELVEVTPIDENQGTWKKWTPLSSLFKVGSPK